MCAFKKKKKEKKKAFLFCLCLDNSTTSRKAKIAGCWLGFVSERLERTVTVVSADTFSRGFKRSRYAVHTVGPADPTLERFGPVWIVLARGSVPRKRQTAWPLTPSLQVFLRRWAAPFLRRFLSNPRGTPSSLLSIFSPQVLLYRVLVSKKQNTVHLSSLL